MLTLLWLLQAASPMPDYWQQRVDYQIDASLDESRGVLGGTERVEYRNQSPSALSSLYFHLYLNAFRPGSRWADADSAERNRRFNDLRDPDFGFNHVSNVRVDGRPVALRYPFAPDSTIVELALEAPIPAGGFVVVEMDWDARPSTLPRRQGRRGRAFDFAQWYPRVAVFDKRGWQAHPLYPAGEFYGEFGSFTVRLDVAEDQVVGATGVPVCGDPGWERANRRPERPVEYQRDHYPEFTRRLAADACAARGPGRKTIVWRAENVHHFAMSLRPDYRYEGGRRGGVLVHVLYQPGDEAGWGGVAVERTEAALGWLTDLFGIYPWPQITNVHRIEGGGTEFPMMIMDGSASLGLILHELGHNYLMGILANNEWREGWLDEGFTSFQTSWFFESASERAGGKGVWEAIYRPTEREILDWDLDQYAEPTSLVSERYRDFATYATMIYGKGELFYQQLRTIVGDEVMRQILRTYYSRWQLKHVDEAAFRQVAEEVSGKDLGTFFAQWLHGTVLYDYAVGRIRAHRIGTPEQDRWAVRVEVRREAEGIFPIEVMVRSDVDTARAVTDGVAERRWVELELRGRPKEVMVDPEARAHDWNMLNNRRRHWLLGWQDAGGRPIDLYVDRVFSTRQRRDREVVALLPTVWYNEAAGVTLGARLRSNYLGRFRETMGELAVGTKRGIDTDRPDLHWYLRYANPTWLRVPRTDVALEGFDLEGRRGAALSVDHRRKGHLGFGPRTSLGWRLQWTATSDLRYLDPLLYDDAGTVESEWYARSDDRWGPWQVGARLAIGAGVEYRNRGAGTATDDRYDAQGYVRGTLDATARRSLGRRSELSLRLFGGTVEAKRQTVRQRWFGLAGAGPYQQLRNPFLRSRDAWLTGGVHFQQPGDANLRGFDPAVLVPRVLAGTVELDRSLWRTDWPIAREARVAIFGDLAWTDGFYSTTSSSDVAGDAGVGLRLRHRIGETDFTTRLDLPLLVSHPDRGRGGDRRVDLRFVVGIER